jgi:hypothetical protein
MLIADVTRFLCVKIDDNITAIRQLIRLCIHELFALKLYRRQLSLFLFVSMIVDIGLMMQLFILVE